MGAEKSIVRMERDTSPPINDTTCAHGGPREHCSLLVAHLLLLGDHDIVGGDLRCLHFLFGVHVGDLFGLGGGCGDSGGSGHDIEISGWNEMESSEDF